MEDRETRAALAEHWSGSPGDDLETALERADRIYHDDVVEYPTVGERILGRAYTTLDRICRLVYYDDRSTLGVRLGRLRPTWWKGADGERDTR